MVNQHNNQQNILTYPMIPSLAFCVVVSEGEIQMQQSTRKLLGLSKSKDYGTLFEGQSVTITSTSKVLADCNPRLLGQHIIDTLKQHRKTSKDQPLALMI